jgi:murein DD-endopeptidase MepM/ murein hydrolase activator NlpD
VRTASFILFIAFIIAPALFAGEITHTIKSGETVYALAKKYGVTEAEILFLNGIEDARKIYAGQKLRIPDGSIEVTPIVEDRSSHGTASKEEKPVYVSHRAIKGDTLFGIAKQYNITISELRSINKLSNSYLLKIGDTLKVPKKLADRASSGTQSNIPSGVPAEPKKPAESKNQSVSAEIAVSNLQNAKLNSKIAWPIPLRETMYMTGKLSGLMMSGAQGEIISCVADGTVVSAGPYRGFGRVVIVQHKDGYLYVYGGCESLSVREGDKVEAGAELGRLGVDAVSGKPQLFFMVQKNNTLIDPAKAPRS